MSGWASAGSLGSADGTHNFLSWNPRIEANENFMLWYVGMATSSLKRWYRCLGGRQPVVYGQQMEHKLRNF